MSQAGGNSASGSGSGTVTSIAAGTGITLTPNPITTTGTVALTIPVTVADGGTGATTLTSHGVLLGNTTGAITATAAGTTGQVLTGVTGSAPTFQSPASSSITITGDSGSGLTGTSFTITGGTSGATFAGAGTTLTESFNFLLLPTSTSSSTGVIEFGAGTRMHNYGAVADANTFVGTGAGNFTLTSGTATNNNGFGRAALSGLTTGSFNHIFGDGAGYTITSGTDNVGIAYNTAAFTTGSRNICIGSNAGSIDGAGTSESDNIYIGFNVAAAVGDAGISNRLIIGNGTGTGAGQLNQSFIAGIQGITVTGTAVLVSASDQLGVAVSSRRFKEKIATMPSITKQLMALRPVTFNYKVGEDRSIQMGLIAEEVNEVIPQLVVLDKEGLPQTVKYHDLPVLLLNEIQQLRKEIEELKRR